MYEGVYMKYLLDTNVLINMFCSPSRLSDHVIAEIRSADALLVSLVSLWEIAIKQSIGKLNLDKTMQDIEQRCKEDGITILPFTLDDLETMKQLPLIHRDPFDRLIVAQAMQRDLAVITSDKTIPRYSIPIVAY